MNRDILDLTSLHEWRQLWLAFIELTRQQVNEANEARTRLASEARERRIPEDSVRISRGAARRARLDDEPPP